MRRMLVTVAMFAAASCGHADIESNCRLNGFGAGRCDFTNAGSASGDMCVKVRVTDKRGLSQPVESVSVCSGELRAHDTRNVEFSVSGLSHLCAQSDADFQLDRNRSWQDNCAMDTIRVSQ